MGLMLTQTQVISGMLLYREGKLIRCKIEKMQAVSVIILKLSDLRFFLVVSFLLFITITVKVFTVFKFAQ